MTQIADLAGLAVTGLWLGVFVFFRVGAAMAVLPAVGEQMLSVRVRLVLALILTVAVLPAVADLLPREEPDVALMLRGVMTETLNGLVLGLALRMFVFALQTAGSIAAQSTSLSQLVGNAGTDPMPALGHILMTAGLALLMLTGFHVKATAYLILSYDILPPFSIPDPAAVAEAGREEVTKSFALAFALSAPFVILSVLYNLTLGFINKAMPQLMVAFVGAPVITFGSVALLLMTAPLLLTVWLGAVDSFLSNPFR
ncbi:flagellar biosynthetic protein FliR [Salipiger sp.]|uniref:flagellar biosynthetic protein FliR n=1 Tax=Salipiger sp. TaxID=2078585 RepID=UPI003A969C67